MQPMGGPPPVKKKRRWLIWLGVGLGSLALVCCGVSVGSVVFDAERGQSLDRASDSPAATAGTSSAPIAPVATPKATAVVGPKTKITEGTWAVGAEIAPGTYRTVVPAGSFGCYYERLRGFSGTFADIIANDNLSAGATGRVTIAPSDKGFNASGDCVWEKVA